MTEQHLRIGDAERDAAAADLGEHFAQGRLTAGEHAERLDRIWAARSRSDLTPVFADLPGPDVARPSSPTSPARPVTRGVRPAGRGWSAPLVAVVAMLLLLTVVTHMPFLLFGLLALWFVTHRHHGRGRWRGHHPGWR